VAANQVLWIYTNPYVGSPPYPNYKTMFLTHHTLLFLTASFLCAVAVDANQTLWFLTNHYVGSLPHPNPVI